ncbi:T9SS type A sorting domain-containing protein [Marixanthomonas ophiurae]|uniref:T9SS C-terminal target domain-containing protein n=1 Tax=Marixanthomonas ophiurae TaxID=387659 RepID=A0A3E1Q8U7_9FLAO|nr:T9SS type A sorting domain-containing protein [Marixanthomonas ophiurae]RFN58567.1 T9SS C-terminal target domain-containing protein [Marixanthomonas ophiurae]
MKKITLLPLLFILLTFGMQAQVFPNPYCEIADPSDTTVEEITAVNFAGTNITNNDASAVLINKTETIIGITPSETYTISVEGDTKGDFDNDIVAFIDWNQNEVLDDANEIYEIGTLTNSTGDDGVSVSMDIMVPSDAVLGTTRIRITKTYTDEDSVAEIDPCAIAFNPFGQGIFPGYGQALDFTLNVGTLTTENFDVNSFSAYPIPTQNVLNLSYKSEISSVKIYNLLGQEQEVYTQNKTASTLQLNVSKLTTGAYIVKLVSEEGYYSFNMLKQ